MAFLPLLAGLLLSMFCIELEQPLGSTGNASALPDDTHQDASHIAETSAQGPAT